jgi:RecB family exonuclease
VKIRFGLGLDGQAAWKSGDRLAQATVGPLGMLGILETHLGLLRDAPSQAERVVQYRQCLAGELGTNPFYCRSFQADELGTAATLLRWRDDWHLHGWDGAFATGASARLQDMARVERRAESVVAPGIGQRLAQALRLLAGVKLPIEEVQLVDALSDFPARWRALLLALPVKEPWALQPHASAGLLRKLQERLINDAATKPLPWQDDDTLVVVRAETRLLAARWLAASMREGGEDMVLLGAADAPLLDEIRSEAGCARTGFREASALRPTLQVLPLAFAAIWKPLDFQGVLQFLTHPVCPLSGAARRLLAEKLADRPGIGGPGWDEVLVAIDEKAGESKDEVRAAIKFWLECPRYSASEGAPIDILTERAGALAKYFQARLARADLSTLEGRAQATLFGAAHSQAGELLSALADLGKHEPRIRPYQLQQLLAQVTARGSDNPKIFQELGSALRAEAPDALIEPVSKVVWWQAAAPILPRTYPWSISEQAQLAQAGVQLPDLSAELQRVAKTWLRPVFAAQEQLVLVLPPEGEEVHPMWLKLQALIEKPLVLRLEDWLEASKEKGVLEPVATKPLPERRRWWAMAGGIEVSTGREYSFSSLTPFLHNPYEWVLKYPARLRPSRILEINDGPLLFGNISHRLIELFFQQQGALTLAKPVIDNWYASTFDSVVEQEGAVLLAPGRRTDLDRLRDQLRYSLDRIVEQLKAAGVHRVEPEKILAGTFAGGALRGFADLVVWKKSGEAAVVDVKWSGQKYYQDQIRANQHLQLGLYAQLLSQQGVKLPDVAFFTVMNATLYARDSGFFPKAIATGGDGSLLEQWQAFGQSWKWREGQLRNGRIEVVLEGVEPTEESTPPANGLQPIQLNEAWSDYPTLAGWESGS